MSPQTNPYNSDLSNEAWVDLLLARHAAGGLSFHDVLPAVWVGVSDGHLPLDHIHLPDNTSVDYAAEVDGTTGRGDGLLSCPPTAMGLLSAYLQARVLIVYLN